MLLFLTRVINSQHMVNGEQIFTKYPQVSQELRKLIISLYHNDLGDSGDSFNNLR